MSAQISSLSSLNEGQVLNAPALGMIELCSIAQGMVACDTALKRAHVKVEWARVYNPGKFVILFRGGEEEVAEALKEARMTAGDYEVDHLLLPHPHPQLNRALVQDVHPSPLSEDPLGLELPAVGILECYSLCATLRAADAGCKEAPVSLLTVRLDPTLGGKGCLLWAGMLDEVDAALTRGRSAAGLAFLYHTQLIPRPHPELALTLVTSYPSPRNPVHLSVSNDS